jgi:hypothetical protein
MIFDVEFQQEHHRSPLPGDIWSMLHKIVGGSDLLMFMATTFTHELRTMREDQLAAYCTFSTAINPAIYTRFSHYRAKGYSTRFEID